MNKIKIIGHRGNKELFLENTIESFKSILEMDGVDGLELDIVVTKDKQLVISHDMFLIDDFNQKHYIYELTYEELMILNENVKKNKIKKKGRRYPLLEDFLNLHKLYNFEKEVFLEIKSIPAFQLPLNYEEIVEKIFYLLNKYNVVMDKYNIISFDYRMLKKVKEINKDVNTYMILHRNLLPFNSIVSMFQDLDINGIIMEKNWWTDELIKNILKKWEVFLWTPNNEEEWKNLIKFKPNGLITDKPLKLKLFLERYKNEK